MYIIAYAKLRGSWTNYHLRALHLNLTIRTKCQVNFSLKEKSYEKPSHYKVTSSNLKKKTSIDPSKQFLKINLIHYISESCDSTIKNLTELGLGI